MGVDVGVGEDSVGVVGIGVVSGVDVGVSVGDGDASGVRVGVGVTSGVVEAVGVEVGVDIGVDVAVGEGVIVGVMPEFLTIAVNCSSVTHTLPTQSSFVSTLVKTASVEDIFATTQSPAPCMMFFTARAILSTKDWEFIYSVVEAVELAKALI